uniref:3-oxo-5-alpha-steroid 4-dehydrogenase C-terminal domain-containing protein n=1 Tax=Ananas comosus var. bracteatus TaxID=296719 RepID=A0A6V7QN13_ANACO|nr:unnamed protein product [Ananas comosus var. bracteatus]
MGSPWSWASSLSSASRGSRRRCPSSSPPFRFRSPDSRTGSSRESPEGEDREAFFQCPSHTVEHKHHVWQTVFVLLLMEIQLLRRLYETINVFHYGPSAQMHIFGYLAGLFFYIAAPLSLGSSCLLEALNYARDQIAEFIVKGRARMPDIEGSLRENKGADEYVIPHGDWFRYVSCPHYLAEIVVYAGILVASGGFDITVWLLFSFVVAT